MSAAEPPLIDRDGVRERFAVAPMASMRDTLALIDRNGEGVALVIDDDDRLQGIVTDGDVRRAILNRIDLEQPVMTFIEANRRRGWEVPLSVPEDTPPAEIERLMKVRLVRHMPLVDAEDRVSGLALQRLLQEEETELGLQAVVMAGGFGKRLRPLTAHTPKPLLKIGNKPVLERIVDQLRETGIRRVNITTHFQAEKIRDFIGDGTAFGVDVHYTHEETPLGTAGALSMLPATEEPLLVVNGDVLTAVDYRAMLDFHHEHGAEMTVGVRRYEVAVPFGVVESDGERVTGLREKPSIQFFINAGIYLLEPSVLKEVPEGRHFDMTDLIQQLVDQGRRVASFPIHESWVDIGQMDDYLRVSQGPDGSS